MELHHLLERFKTLYMKGKDTRGHIVSVIKEICSIELSNDNIDVKEGIVLIKGIHPLKKQIIVTQEKKLISELFSRFQIEIKSIH